MMRCLPLPAGTCLVFGQRMRVTVVAKGGARRAWSLWQRRKPWLPVGFSFAQGVL